MMHAPTSIDELFKALGGPSKIARVIGKGSSTASEMKRRQSIPVQYWSALIDAAQENGVEGISYETLAQMHSARAEAKASAA